MTQRVVNYTYGTGNQVLPDGSIDVRDGIDNLQSFDIFMNADEDTYNQRDGDIVQTVAGALKATGFKPGSGDFTTGFTVLPGQYNISWHDHVSKNWYSYLGVIPSGGYTVSPGTNPVGSSLWKPVTDSILREDLAVPGGSNIVGFQQDGTGSTPRTAQDKMRENRSTLDYGAVGNGVTDDTSAFAVMSGLSADKPIDGLGKTYLVTAIPVAGVFFNGMWKVGSTLTPFEYVGVIRAGNNVIAIGQNAAPGSISDDFIAIGRDAGAAAVEARNCIAIGKGAMLSNRYGRHNLALGLEALRSITGSPSDSIVGSRNIGMGGNTGRFLKGSRNLIFGRDAGHNLTDAHLNLIMGVAAVMGDGPNTLDPGVIENQTPLTPSYSIMLGAETGKYWNAGYGVGVGHQALMNVKSDTGIVGIGSNAFSLHQSDMSHWGTTQQLVNRVGTYSQSGGTAITVSVAAHGLTSGFRVLLRFTTGANGDVTYHDDNWFVVTVIDSNTFTIQSPVSAIASGNVSVSKIATTTPYSALTGGCVGVGRDVGNGTSNYHSTGVGDRVGPKGLGVETSGFGYNVFLNYVPGAGSTAAGAYSQQSNNNAGGNTSFGVLTMAGNILTGVSNSAFGPQALRYVSSGSNNVAVGGNALRGLTTGNTNTAVGVDALRYQSGGGTTDHNYNNCSGLGYQSYCSGDNQVQLGNSATTTYVYGTVQNRSDARDKTDVQDTSLGIEFIMGLRPVDGRWDMRDDYWEEYDEQVGVDAEGLPVFETKRRQLPKDGSRARQRKHHWFIAQEVKELCDSLGVEFGGYQDLSVNGGCDVLTLGYDEFIPPTIKAVQQCWTRLDELEKRIASLE